MKRKPIRPTREEDARIVAAIAADPNAAPDLSKTRHGIVRRVGRPPAANPKQAVSMRLDADVLAHFRATGPGWQSRVNAVLRRAAKMKRVRS